MDYANTDLLREGHKSFCAGGNMRLLTILPSMMDCSDTKSTMVPWPNQLKNKLLRSNNTGTLFLHQIQLSKDLSALQTILECLPKDNDIECCLVCFDLKLLINIPMEQLRKDLHDLADKTHKAGRICVFITSPPLTQEDGKWLLDIRNDLDACILAEIREVANGLQIPFIDIYAIWKNGVGLKALREDLIVDPQYGITHYGHAIIADQIWDAFNRLSEQPLEYSWLD